MISERISFDGDWSNIIIMVIVGIVAGTSVSLLDTEVVLLPIFGDVPGLFLGVPGIALSLIAFQRASCCGMNGIIPSRNSRGCGCSDKCEDHCSYEPE